MKFNDSIYNPDVLEPTEEFKEAYALISTCKSWKKWNKIVTKPVYERIREEARMAIESFGLDVRFFNDLMRDTIDYYLEHGTLKPKYQQFNWEMGLLAIFKKEIDAAWRRRYRAMLAAAKRRENKAASRQHDAAMRPQSELSVSMSDREVDTEIEGGVGVKGHTLLGELADGVVHAGKEVEAGSMEVKKPAEAAAPGAYSSVDVKRYNLDGTHIGRQAELSPTILAVDAG